MLVKNNIQELQLVLHYLRQNYILNKYCSVLYVLIKYLLYIQIYKKQRTKLMVTLLVKINILTLKILFKYKKFLKQC